MDLEGLIELLRGIKDGTIRCLAVDTPAPSQFAHELLNANPYAYLDEAGLEERRARATSLGRTLPDEPGKIDLAALIALPLFVIDREETRHWPTFFERLTQKGRAQTLNLNGTPSWVATERL